MSSINKNLLIHDGWLVHQSLANSIISPVDNCFDELPCFEAEVPGSLFSSLDKSNVSLSDVEDFDWWYTCDFIISDFKVFSQHQIIFDRLATLAEVWLNDVPILSSNNMFLSPGIDVVNAIKENNRLVICFRSVGQFLKQRRPRPKWKTNLVEQQQLRWLRTSLLGRIPGWSSTKPALGPCGNIILNSSNDYLIKDTHVHTRMDSNSGIVDAKISIAGNVQSVYLKIGENISELNLQKSNQDSLFQMFTGEFIVENPSLWWPCTHGEQKLYPCQLRVHTEKGESIIDLGFRAFRDIQLDTDENKLQLSVNNKPIFARGACWTITDVNSFFSSKEEIRPLLLRARSANINMLRVGGTMTYEQNDFYSICDELGIMIWQDFMFANMDYPVDDADFQKNISTEVNSQLSRLSQYACVAVYCGNSEIQQQAAMVGVERENWSNNFFDKLLPELCNEYDPGSLYFPSTPCGGALPFHISEGISHFYGVGAYKKSLLASGVREVKFTTESLGFSNVPEPEKVDAIFNGNRPASHSPVWKQGIPRDTGAGWDFEDIRDYYLQEMFHIDPVLLRSRDTQRYLALSRVVTGELFKLVISHWRSPDTPCSGALLWFYKDLLPGAGWGLLDNQGDPKSVYYYIQRAFQPLAAFLIDRGLDGLDALILNETSEEQNLRIDIKLLSCPDVVVEHYSNDIQIQADSHWKVNLEGLLGYFRDVNYSYQFGMMQYQLVSLQVYDTGTEELLTEDTYFLNSLHLKDEQTAIIEFDLLCIKGNQYLSIQSDRFLQSVHIDIPRLQIENNYFHMLPNVSKRILLGKADNPIESIKGYLSAVNLSIPIRISVKQDLLNER